MINIGLLMLSYKQSGLKLTTSNQIFPYSLFTLIKSILTIKHFSLCMLIQSFGSEVNSLNFRNNCSIRYYVHRPSQYRFNPREGAGNGVQYVSISASTNQVIVLVKDMLFPVGHSIQKHNKESNWSSNKLELQQGVNTLYHIRNNTKSQTR